MSAFLQAQRARLRPEDVGLAPDSVPRRVPGLRREEVARLAGMSTDYYTRLEQGRKLSPSESVLNSIARALQLDEVGHRHLLDLGRPTSVGTGRISSPQRVRASTRQLMESWPDQPALLLGRRLDVLATNALGRALIFDFGTLPPNERNYVRWVILHPHARELYPDWPAVAEEMVALLRMEAGRFPDDPGIIDLVGELAVKSDEFATWWADQRVTAHTHGSKRFRHPVVGELELEWQGLALPGDEHQTIYLYHAAPGSPAADKIGLLGSWVAGVPAAGADLASHSLPGSEAVVDEPA